MSVFCTGSIAVLLFVRERISFLVFRSSASHISFVDISSNSSHSKLVQTFLVETIRSIFLLRYAFRNCRWYSWSNATPYSVDLFLALVGTSCSIHVSCSIRCNMLTNGEKHVSSMRCLPSRY